MKNTKTFNLKFASAFYQDPDIKKLAIYKENRKKCGIYM